MLLDELQARALAQEVQVDCVEDEQCIGVLPVQRVANLGEGVAPRYEEEVVRLPQRECRHHPEGGDHVHAEPLQQLGVPLVRAVPGALHRDDRDVAAHREQQLDHRERANRARIAVGLRQHLVDPQHAEEVHARCRDVRVHGLVRLPARGRHLARRHMVAKLR